MKINIASSHRFHLLDLARELSKQGHDVRFYSYVPTKRCVKYGMRKEQCRCLLPFLIPYFILEKLFLHSSWHRKWRDRTMDFIVGHFMRRCDVYIALGTVYLDSFTLAKKRFGATTILEWGSKHIDEQQRILASIRAHLNEEYFNERSRRAYEVVDYISVATKHVVDSFLKHGISEKKLIKNPYGVNLKDFYPIDNQERIYDVIMVGNFGLQKGCDLIVEGVRKAGVAFLHVGSIVGDVPFPEEKNFTHIDPVDQKDLVKYYSQAKVFLLPSRQEGLAMVQAQAIACNLPLIGSMDSGAEDLQEMVELPDYITIVKTFTSDEISSAIHDSLDKYKKLQGQTYAGGAISNLTWEAYGNRYSKFLISSAITDGGGKNT